VLHENIVPNALVISSTINWIVKHHHSAWTNKLVLKIAVWARPSPPYYKVNYDTTIRQDFSAQAAVCRDSRGTIIGCFTLISPPCSPVFGETTTALLACCLAISLELQHFILEGDSFVVTLSLHNPNLTQDWRISSVISHIFFDTPSTTSWSASHVNRSANFCAHHVAN
jgi:hypothetical protein